ncbi:hypothetical protein COU13_00295 [Candidatus Kaiserbacteria bacterium CG10_big_fil_rev_8_21_14_0_10_43_70]|uniref:Uncharacterized protein n=1 Tax=Candidatus Kaiserbacteria bacterium CG10_big_fil_rev_8_21_14_0_10_43_70 TaxID=1974605 RepID=A0A2H0ULA4_9BACT|nr:MAG: hypothetical protein COU13_00295 [Candidatus Kaiserbacteria bacterium CG10_big_fil_rev_8_21_14_0_10_43_70]
MVRSSFSVNISFTLVLLFSFLLVFSSFESLYAQTDDPLYDAILKSIGKEDEELARELSRAAASAGISVADIENPLPPIPQQEGVFTEQTAIRNSNKSIDGEVGTGFNFLLVSIGVALAVFLSLLFALSRRFSHEKERIDLENIERVELQKLPQDNEESGFIPSSRNLD